MLALIKNFKKDHQGKLFHLKVAEKDEVTWVLLKSNISYQL